MNCAAIIIGIENWAKYTLPLVESIRKHESGCRIIVVDNASPIPYPQDAKTANLGAGNQNSLYTIRTERLCYSAAINAGKAMLNKGYDWYIVLSNDVLCTGPFEHLLTPLPPCVAGPQLWHEHGLQWIVGWCVCIPRVVWDAVGGWDEGYVMSSVEDVDLSVSAVEKGYALYQMPELPFVHLDQRQRFGLPGYEGSELLNWQHFIKKHSGVRA